MNARHLVFATLLAGFGAGALPAAATAGDEAAAAALLEAKAPTVVTVKFVVKLRHPQMGDQETNADARGVVVDPAGLVMLGNDSLEPGGGILRMMRRRPGGADLVTTPLDFKVLFGSDNPVIQPDRWLADFEKLPIKPEVRPLILKENAARLLKLK